MNYVQVGLNHDKGWARQGQARDDFVGDMWARERSALAAPTDGWKRPHDDSAYRAALEQSR